MLRNIPKYKDLPFFISKNAFTSDFNTVNDLSAVQQAIKNIILTTSGERFFNYNFGANVYKGLFENFTLELITTLQSNIANNLTLYEERININDIRMVEVPKENKLEIYVDFHIPTLNISDIVQIDIARIR